MKKYKKIILIVSVVLIVAMIVGYYFFPTSPLSSLSATDINEIHLLVVPPEQKIILNQEQVIQVVELIQGIKVYQRGYTENVTTGQVVNFTIIKADGEGIELSCSGNTSITINGITYRVDYTSAESLNAFANKVLK